MTNAMNVVELLVMAQTTLRRELAVLDRALAELGATAVTAPAPAALAPKPPGAKAAAGMPKNGAGSRRKPRRPNGLMARLLETAAGLKAPFDAIALAAEVGGCTQKEISSALRYAAKTGRLKVLRAGGPHRPALYELACGRVAAPAVNIEGLDEPKLSRAERLKKAQEDLSTARRAGNETLAAILMDKVAMLQPKG